jgi:response regulator RpfG family c-di-GMP phosphodiesterase
MSVEMNSHDNDRPTIFLVEEDDDVRPILTRNLRGQGYRLLVAATLEDAHEWVSGESLINADLVLINLVRKTPEESVRLGRELREHAKYDGYTPLVVLPETVPRELVGKIVNVSENDWICYYDEESNHLPPLLARLLEKSLS